MAKKKPKPVSLKKPRDPERSARIHRAIVHTLVAVVLLAGLGVGVLLLKRHVEKRLAFHGEAPKVVLVNRPPWMSDFVAEQIAATARPRGAHSSFDRQMLVDAADMLRASPWIREVKQVRRVYGQAPGDTLEVDCEYRAPIALVHWKDYFWLVDGEGIKLPEQFTAEHVPRIVMGRDRKMNIRIIEGVERPPPESGQQWNGDDLRAGLELAKLLYGRPSAEEILKVDVANFHGRKDPREAQLVLITKYKTEVRWGRPVNAKDYFIEVSTSQKLKYLDQVYEQFKRVDGHRPWIDIRFDKITYPAAEAQAAHADTNR